MWPRTVQLTVLAAAVTLHASDAGAEGTPPIPEQPAVQAVSSTAQDVQAAEIAVGAPSAPARGMGWESVGMRLGYSFTSFSNPFLQAEMYTAWRLPWTCDVGKNWTFAPNLELSAGALTAHRQSGFVGAFGPVAVFRPKNSAVYVECGVRPTVLSREVYGDRDLGCPFQFTSHLGLGWDMGKRWTLCYRFQHTSNARLAYPNPGLNMNILGLGYRF